MLKYALLAGALTMSLPAVAQTTAAPATGSIEQSTAPQATPSTDAAPASPSAATDPTAAAPSTAAAATQPAATGPAQVAQVVDTEFPTYDKDSNGTLSSTEFASWMVALKSASDPSAKADSPATKAWIKGAFASADKDKSRSVSKTELTGFLSQNAG